MNDLTKKVFVVINGNRVYGTEIGRSRSFLSTKVEVQFDLTISREFSSWRVHNA